MLRTHPVLAVETIPEVHNLLQSLCKTVYISPVLRQYSGWQNVRTCKNSIKRCSKGDALPLATVYRGTSLLSNITPSSSLNTRSEAGHTFINLKLAAKTLANLCQVRFLGPLMGRGEREEKVGR